MKRDAFNGKGTVVGQSKKKSGPLQGREMLMIGKGVGRGGKETKKSVYRQGTTGRGKTRGIRENWMPEISAPPASHPNDQFAEVKTLFVRKLRVSHENQ